MIYRALFSNFFLMLLLAAGTSSIAEEKKDECNQIIVGFSKDADKSEIKALEDKFKLTAVKKFKRIHAICYKFEDGANLDALIKKLQQEKAVRYAERNGKVSNKS